LHAALSRVLVESEGSSEWISLVQRTIATQLRELVTELPAAARLAVAWKDPDGTPAVANLTTALPPPNEGLLGAGSHTQLPA